jgi:hypothetical protein
MPADLSVVVAQAAPNAGGMIAGLLCGLIAGVLIGGTIGAILIRAAVWLTNKVAGATIPDPSFGRAFAMAITTVIVNWVIGFVMGIVMGGAGGDPQMIRIVSALISIPVSFLVLAGVASAMLPTSFPRACLVALFYILIAIAIGVVIVGLMFMVFGGLAVMQR